jgi:hypothetical protein
MHPAQGNPRANGKRILYGPSPAKLVWLIWASLLLTQLALIALYGSDVPLLDDWSVVPPLAGEANPLTWLWEFHNEHWIPLPKAILLGLVCLTRGDFRVGMVVNVALMGVFAASMIVAARRLRGRTAYADAFFPLVLLHGGHASTFFWCWQVGFGLPAALAGAILGILVQAPDDLTLRRLTLTGALLVLLPLCGANGLAMVPAISIWFFLCASRDWGQVHVWTKRERVLIAAPAALALGLAAVNGTRLARLEDLRPSPTVARTMVAAFRFCSTSVGLSPWPLWFVAGCLVLGLALVIVALLAIQAVRREDKRLQVAGVFCFLLAMGSLSVALGWGRGRMGGEAGLADRYSVLAVSWLCCIYLGWLVVGGPFAKPVTAALAIVAALIAVPNMVVGFDLARNRYYNMWYVRHDLDTGVSAQLFALRYSRIPFVLFPNEEALANYVTILRRSGVPRFRKVTLALPSPVPCVNATVSRPSQSPFPFFSSKGWWESFQFSILVCPCPNVVIGGAPDGRAGCLSPDPGRNDF